MADEADLAQAQAEIHLAHNIAAACRPIPAGAPGECENCGEDSARLVGGWCARCRDRGRRW